jgi:hypothetical protein
MVTGCNNVTAESTSVLHGVVTELQGVQQFLHGVLTEQQ